MHAPLDSPGTVPQVHSTFRSFHQPWEIDQTRQMSTSIGPAYPHSVYCTVPIKVLCPFLFSYVRHVGDAFDVEKVTSRLLQIRTGRGKSLESLEDPTERTHHTFSTENTHTTFHYNQPQVGWRPRSYDDGDITPTNETGLFYEGGGTLPRPRGIIRPRQIAKITAKVR